MRDRIKHLPVNWIDGMKINKNHFIAQDDAWKDSLNDVAALCTSPLRFGVLNSSAEGENNFDVRISLDNQNTVRISVIACQAITPGGIRVNLPVSAAMPENGETDGVPAVSFQFSKSMGEGAWFAVLTVHPFQKAPAGSPDLSENPPRFPFLLPTYTVQVVNESQYPQYAYHPYALIVGKFFVQATDIRIEENYIPPCYSISALHDLLSLHAEVDQFLSTLEMRCSQIVQKIFKKNQQNDISELVLFLCDRTILYLGQAITNMRWMMMHESPAALFSCLASLARVMKNSIDLRTGSGKEEMMNYLSEWCELKQGELETMLSALADLRYDNNDINKSIQKITQFVKVTSRLFETLSKLEFIGKRKDSGIFVKEEKPVSVDSQQNKARRRFFG